MQTNITMGLDRPSETSVFCDRDESDEVVTATHETEEHLAVTFSEPLPTEPPMNLCL